MTEKTNHVIEFYKLLNFLSNYASCTSERSNYLSFNPSFDLKSINNEQRMVSEVKLIPSAKGFFPFRD